MLYRYVGDQPVSPDEVRALPVYVKQFYTDVSLSLGESEKTRCAHQLAPSP